MIDEILCIGIIGTYIIIIYFTGNDDIAYVSYLDTAIYNYTRTTRVENRRVFRVKTPKTPEKNV